MQDHTPPAARHQSTATRTQERFAVSSNITLLTRFDVAESLSQCVRTVDDAIASGELEYVKIGRSVRIRPIALERFIEARITRGNPHCKARRKATAAAM